MIDPDIGAACIQFLFSAVYHLKSAVLPYSSDLLKLALKFLGKESEKVLKPSFEYFVDYMNGPFCFRRTSV